MESISGSTSTIGMAMAQVAYHVQLTWLLVTAVTPDRLETTRLDAGTMVLYICSLNIILSTNWNMGMSRADTQYM
jgi:hypothetical protein